jgi:NADPH-dependent curcumin reductase CurA
MSASNRQWVLVRRPEARVEEGCFELRKTPVPEPQEAQALVRARWLAFEPAMRGWVDDGSLVWDVDVQCGFENAPKTLVRLYNRENFGKQLLEL